MDMVILLAASIRSPGTTDKRADLAASPCFAS